MKRKIAAISPLALLTLSACGGGSSGGGVTASLRDFAGNAVKVHFKMLSFSRP